jgi:acetophenone carboxylase
LYAIDVDTGGTMTDTLVSGGPMPVLIKVESTPHDVTVSFMQSLAAAAAAAGFASLGAFLDEVRLIRWTSTLTSNVLAQRKGPKLGLIVSPGHEHALYAEDPADTAAVMPWLVRPEHVVSLPDRADRGAIVALVKRLIDQGIRRINVSLAGAYPDGAREQEVLAVIAEQFPDHFLGSVPALAGSEMLMQPDDMSRTFYALINAYVHNALANSLFKAEDQVKVEHDWQGDILVGHLNGGVARIGKTKAVDTIESGPLFGTHASAELATRLAVPRVLAMDVGGTTGKLSAITDGRIEMRPQGHIFGIPVRAPLPVLRSNEIGRAHV